MNEILPELESVLAYLEDLPKWAIYFFLALSSLTENVFPPWPGDAYIVFAGFLAAHDIIGIVEAFLAAMLGNVIGAYIMYYSGVGILGFARRMHAYINRPRFIKRTLENLTSTASMQKTEVWFEKYGAWFVLFSRFFAGVRFFVAVVAGVSRMNLALFTISFAGGVVLWNTILLWGGYALGDNWRLILTWLNLYVKIAMGFLFVLLLAFIVYRKTRRQQTPAELETTKEITQKHESEKS